MTGANGRPGNFDYKKLETLAQQFRQEEAQAAVTLAATRKGNLSLQPQLTFKTFSAQHVQAAVSPDCSYRLLVSALQAAKRSITAYVYNIGADYILDVLRDRLAHGVKVRVMVDPNDPNDQRSEEFTKLQRLGMGIQLQLSPSSAARPIFTVCHQKFVVIDHETTIVESANWAASSIPKATKPGQYVPGNREWLVRVDAADVAAWFEDLFEKDWNIPPPLGLSVVSPVPVVPTSLLAASAMTPPGQLFNIGTARKSAKLVPVVSPLNYRSKIGALLSSAKRRIYLQQQYITAGDGVNELLEIVHDKAKSCDVKIIVSPKYVPSWLATVKTLKAAGLYRKLRAQNIEHVVHCHNKGVIVDDENVLVSSTNWSENSILRARETGLLMTSADLTQYYASVFELDWSEAINPARVAGKTIAVAATEIL